MHKPISRNSLQIDLQMWNIKQHSIDCLEQDVMLNVNLNGGTVENMVKLVSGGMLLA